MAVDPHGRSPAWRATRPDISDGRRCPGRKRPSRSGEKTSEYTAEIEPCRRHPGSPSSAGKSARVWHSQRARGQRFRHRNVRQGTRSRSTLANRRNPRSQMQSLEGTSGLVRITGVQICSSGPGAGGFSMPCARDARRDTAATRKAPSMRVRGSRPRRPPRGELTSPRKR